MKYILALFAVFMLSGCVTKTHTIYVNPDFPNLPQIQKVPQTQNTYIQEGCLYFDKRNSNLCGDDLIVVLKQIKKLRTNEDTCLKVTDEYNLWVKAQDKNETVEDTFEFHWF